MCEYKPDYIIIGSGPSGCGAAYGIIKNNYSIQMFEAGPDYDTDEQIKDPKYALSLEQTNYSKYHWTIQQQTNIIPCNNYTNGRLSGGGSSINHMQYCKGSNALFTKWYELTNDPDWCPNHIFKLYKELEKTSIVGRSRGKNGLLKCRLPKSVNNSSVKFCKALTNSFDNFPLLDDYNNPDTPLGPFHNWQYAQDNYGNRASSSTAFIKPYLKQNENFKIMYKASIISIIFKKKKAVGVKYMYNNEIKNMYCSKGIILCAGIQTPLILEHSGIGNKEILEKYNINCISNLPHVGENLYNHLILKLKFSKNKHDKKSNDTSDLYSFGAFYPSNLNCNTMLNNRHIRNVQWIGYEDDENLYVYIVQLQPKSKGYVHIQNNDYLAPPIVDEHPLKEEEDIIFFKNIIRTQVLQVADELHHIDHHYKLLEPCISKIDNDIYLEQYIKNNILHAHHWQSQCKMGKNKKNGVVDNNGKVFGTKHLYIADCCIFPISIDNNTGIPAYVTGYNIGLKLCK